MAQYDRELGEAAQANSPHISGEEGHRKAPDLLKGHCSQLVSWSEARARGGHFPFSLNLLD